MTEDIDKKRDDLLKTIQYQKSNLISDIKELPISELITRVVIKRTSYNDTTIEFEDRFENSFKINKEYNSLKVRLIALFDLIIKYYSIPYGLFPSGDLTIKLVIHLNLSVCHTELKYKNLIIK